MSARALSNRMVSQYPDVRNTRIQYISDATLDNRVRGIYKKLLKNDVVLAHVMVNDTIWTLNNAEHESIETVKYAIPVMYKVLLDLSLNRIDEAHNKLREVHYHIYNKYL